MKKYVVYHSYCCDGFGAAWAAWTKFGSSAEYIPYTLGDPIPYIETGSELYICDTSFNRGVLMHFKQVCSKVMILDHHKTAAESLEGLDFAIFDMNRSGALIAWEYFHPDSPIPLLIQHISDRDLWKHEINGSRAVHSLLKSFKFDFETWEQFSIDLEKNPDTIYNAGNVINYYAMHPIKKLCLETPLKHFYGYKVPMCNLTTISKVDWSEIGAKLLEIYPDAPFAISYWDKEDSTHKLSFRSRQTDSPPYDVAKLAKRFPGGGGHECAAGATLTRKMWENKSDATVHTIV